MGYKIGMDFGTTNSTVAYINPDTKQVEAFKYPPAVGFEYIPSCVAYGEDQQAFIGSAATPSFLNEEAVVLCSNMKMILPMPPEKRRMVEWTHSKSPEDSITDYLKHILTVSGEDALSFTSQKGAIDALVLSVPHVWAKDPGHIGRSALQTIVRERLKLNLIQLISEPVAAAAYFAHQHRANHKQDFTGNVLICDMGDGTFDVTLCRILPGKIEELFNDGNGKIDMGKAGVRFDTRLLTSAGLTENTPEFYEAYKLLQEHKTHNHSKITQSLITAIENPETCGEINILIAGRAYKFNYHHIIDAFEDIQQGIEKVLQRVQAGINSMGASVDQVFFVGGFSQFYLVRDAIKTCLGIGGQRGDIRLIRDVNNEISRYAIAFGAALIANDRITVEERFEHTIGVCGVRHEEQAEGIYIQEETLIPILKGGKKLSEYEQTVFAEKQVRTFQKNPEISVFVDLSSRNRSIISRLPDQIELPNAHIPENRWKLGMRIDKSKVVYLIFRDVMYQGETEYELGDIIRRMFSGLVVED